MRAAIRAGLVLCALTPAVARAGEPPKAPAPAATPAAPVPPSAAPVPVPADVKLYTFALLRKGPKWTADETPEVLELQRGHLANLERLGREGKLVAAGPSGDGDLRGIVILAVESPEEAQALIATDPAVQAGRLKSEARRFVGPAGIGRRVEAERAKAGKVEMVEYQLALVRLGRHFRPGEAAENRALFMARNAWLKELERSGRLALSGPFVGSADLTGVLVLRAGSVAAARTLVEQDPAVKTERFTVDVHPLWLAKGALD